MHTVTKLSKNSAYGDFVKRGFLTYMVIEANVIHSFDAGHILMREGVYYFANPWNGTFRADSSECTNSCTHGTPLT